MTKRAIILVPGFGKHQQLEARDRLVDAICAYSEGYRLTKLDPTEDQSQNSVCIRAESRQTGEETSLHVYEAYWGDLLPDWSSESPWARFKRGFSLISYWFLGGLRKSIFRFEFPARTLIGLSGFGIVMLFWYLVVVVLLLQAYFAAQDSFPPIISSVLKYLCVEDQLKAYVESLSAAPVFIFIIGLATTGFIERTSNTAAFAKAYLQDRALDGGSVGLRGKTRTRVRTVLDHVHSSGDFDEVYVVAHSFGGAIAVDALAEYGDALSKTVLHTWGSAMGSLVQQEPLIELEIGKFYTSRTRIANWIDIVFSVDMLGSKVPIPHKYVDGRKQKKFAPIFPETKIPRTPARLGWRFTELHEYYYRCEEAILYLIMPQSDLPKPKED